MTLVGLDLDATRARAVHGPASSTAAVLRLAEPHAELPLAVSLQGRQPQVGGAALALCRRLPDCACLDFLPHLGRPRVWSAGRHCLDAERALSLAFDHLARSLGKASGVTAALPAYLQAEQIELLTHLAGKARWRLLGTVPAPLAAARAAHDRLPWSGLALVLDVDGHALTWSAVAVSEDTARLAESQSFPPLARGAWLGRLLGGVAHRCVRQCRRDPCESAEAEQDLYAQLVQLLEEPPRGDQGANLVLQAGPWYQRLTFQTAELAAMCQPLVRQTLAALQGILQSLAGHGPIGAVVLTPAAAHLPGLAQALASAQEPTAPAPSAGGDEDFGEGLLQEDGSTSGRVHILGADAVSRAAHDLAVRVHRGDLPSGPLEAVPLPAPPGGAPLAPRPHDTDVPSLRLRLPPRGQTGMPRSEASAPRWRVQPHDD
jgi:hypothetical protein